MPPSESTSRLRLPPQSAVASPDRRIVNLKGGEATDFQRAVEALGGKIARRQEGVGLIEVSGLSDQAAQTLARRSDIDRIDKDMVVQWIPKVEASSYRLAQALTNPGPKAQGSDQSGAFFFQQGYQWNMIQIQAPQAWGPSNGGAGRTVCTLDTGIDPDHLDLSGKVDFATSVITAPVFPGDLDPLDYNAHGTLSAGYISTNGIGVASVAPDARLCSIKVLTVLGSGSFGDVITGIQLATMRHADVINMSLGAYVDGSQDGVEGLIKALQKAVNFASSRGVLVVAAAGNAAIDLNEDPKSFHFIPAELKNVVSVGATAPVDQQNFDNLASYSNFGSAGVDIFAPGGDYEDDNILDLDLGPCSEYQLTLPFTCSFIDYVFAAGTSEAAPHVSGAAAEVQSQFGDRPTAARLEKCLRNSADVIGPARIFGSGRLNVAKAIACAGTP
jgi:subtilisin family serine protease